MVIGYKDFVPTKLKSGFFSTEYEPFSGTLVRANEWIESTGVNVLNVETVVLPNINTASDASQVGIRTSGEMSSYWFQVIRVWYETATPPDPIAP